MGVDVGSITAKVAIVDESGRVVFTAYRRHHARTAETLRGIVADARALLGDVRVGMRVTGSAGLGLCERFALPYMQEVIASVEYARRCHAEVRTLIDIGGEDAKMVFLGEGGMPDIRMNGSCAGGTGAFIDEMANLLGVDVRDLSELAERHREVHTIASRCGVFAKTDVQNLLSRRVPLADVAASIFNAVAMQVLTTLARGYEVRPKVLLAGGPLTFLPALRQAFSRALGFDSAELVEVEHGEVLPALGAAVAEDSPRLELSLREVEGRLSQGSGACGVSADRLESLFGDPGELAAWERRRMDTRIERIEVAEAENGPCYLGIDSGSTTTKIVLMDEAGRIAFSHYAPNNGDPIGAVRHGLDLLVDECRKAGVELHVARSAATGYGEDLIRAAYGLDMGIVETLAHFRAAKAFDPEVSFILDIGGQDMKAVFVSEGHVCNIEINEACSSGCGTFIESFAKSMGYAVQDFACEACSSTAPCDLGTRCTVFMNSRVKQAQREGAAVPDIAAGLAYSVIKNALHKVLRLTDTSVLGDHVIVQGGTFRNPAIQRALELLIGKEVLCPDIAELMGAYGAALAARDSDDGARGQVDGRYSDGQQWLHGLGSMNGADEYERLGFTCNGCENQCLVTKLVFPNGNTFYTGNRCERRISNAGRGRRKGVDFTEVKQRLLFDRPEQLVDRPRLTIGVPRALNMYENYPFWHALLTECGFRVVLSRASTGDLYDSGAGTVASDSICFPAKLAHGHIVDLAARGVDRILYPMVFYEGREYEEATGNFTCPIVAGYADVLRSAIDPRRRYGIPLDSPTVNFNDRVLLAKSCRSYLAGLGVGLRTFVRAFRRAEAAQAEYRARVLAEGARVIEEARRAGRSLIVILGRPYHVDARINHHIPGIVSSMGVDVITEDAVPMDSTAVLVGPCGLAQWSYTNRIYHAARWAAEQPDVEVVQLNSFACGPDAFSLPEVREILTSHGKGHTVIRIDEIESTGSAKLRLRSMVALMDGRTRAQARGDLMQARVDTVQRAGVPA
jgi:predicted CoA-substrate-specific enzyme activase